jgi:hypothetical protein
MTLSVASHIGVFGEGAGEGVFAKTSSPEFLAFLLLPPHLPIFTLKLLFHGFR